MPRKNKIMLQAFQKEQRLRTFVIERDLDDCPRDNPGKLQEVVNRAAEAAYGELFANRFGVFRGRRRCIVYANMGPDKQQWLLGGLRQRLRQSGVQELACGIWPQEGEDRGYTYAVLIDSSDHKSWLKVLREVLFTGR